MLPPSPHGLLYDPARRHFWKWLCAALVTVVGVAALTPSEFAPNVTANDKFDHLLGFAALSATGLLALTPGLGSAVLAGAGMLAYGALIELLQTVVPGRFGDLQDLLADAVGVTLGLAMVTGLRWMFRTRQR